ncbi:(ZYRO0E07744g) [Zygosaccharomyces parabailii]|nr:(ZYRO0E07744g) [Zygosaccharomyces parabailii]CDH12845.1 related to HSP26-Heat shock protein [Zygosaccharomyces bailii ISA1307]
MSYCVPFFDFFDTINNEVVNFNRCLENLGHRNSQQLIANKHHAGKGKVEKTHKKNQQHSTSLNRLLGSDWSISPVSLESTNIVPPLDLFEHDESYEINVAIPGVKSKNDISVEYYRDKNQVVISGKIPCSIAEENKSKIRFKEVASGSFKRVISLPANPGVDASKIKADYSSGVLTVHIPKLKQKEPKGEVLKIEFSSQDSLED